MCETGFIIDAVGNVFVIFARIFFLNLSKCFVVLCCNRNAVVTAPVVAVYSQVFKSIKKRHTVWNPFLTTDFIQSWNRSDHVFYKLFLDAKILLITSPTLFVPGCFQ